MGFLRVESVVAACATLHVARYLRQRMIIPSLILLSVTLLGGLLFVLLGQRGMDNLGLFLSFGGAFIIGMCFLHLVPEAYGIRGDAGVFVLVGFLVQGLLEYLSQGIEHGHIHRHTHDERCGHEFTWGRLPWAALISLGLHSALESMPVLNHAHHDLDHVHAHGMFSLEVLDWGLLTGLMLHKLPVAMVLMAMMLEQHVPKRTAWTILALFGLTPLLGMGVFEAVIHRLEGVDLPTVSAAIQALVVGILLHIGTTVLFEAEEGHRFHGGKFVATCVGLALSVAAFL